MAFLGLLFPGEVAFAQDSSGNRQEVWPEANLFYSINDKFRVFALYSTTKLKNSSYTEGGAGIYLDYFALPWLRGKSPGQTGPDSLRGHYLWFRAGYLYNRTPADAENPFKESTLVTEANLRFQLPYSVILTNKNRMDFRFLNSDFKPRYRIKGTLEKAMHTDYLQFTPYVNGEYYVEFSNNSVNKIRITGGAELRVASHINFETYVLYQFKNAGSPQGLTAMGVILKFYLDHRQLKRKFSK